MDWLEYLRELNCISMIVRILLAMLLGACIGMEREKSGRPAGLRTHILVCVGACMTAIIGVYVWSTTGASDPMRIAAQVISGIGFLGVGTILVKEHDHITGLTTAAGLWTTAAMGIGAGFGYYEAALVCALVVAITTVFLYHLEAKRKKKARKLHIYVEVKDSCKVNVVVDRLGSLVGAREITVIAPKSGVGTHVGLEGYVPLTEEKTAMDALRMLRDDDDIAFAIENYKSEKHMG